MASTIYLADSGNNTLYTFPDGFHLDRYRLSKRTKSVNKAYQHGGDIIGDEKHDLQHISLVGTLGAASIALFESACTLMKQNVVKSNLRLYGAYKTDQYFDIKALESADWDFLTDGGLADVNVRFLADPFRYYQNETISGHTVSGTSVGLTVHNSGDIEVSPVITLTTGVGASISKIKIENSTDRNKYFEYEPAAGLTSGGVVEIDCRSTTCKLNTVDDISHFEGAFIELQSGNNSITVTITGTPGTNTCEFKFRKRYL